MKVQVTGILPGEIHILLLLLSYIKSYSQETHIYQREERVGKALHTY